MGGEGFNGSGTAFVISFRALAPTPNTTIYFTISDLADTVPNPIPHLEYDGYVEILADRDVAVIDISPCKTVVCQGCSMSINATVENQGYYYDETFNLTIVAGDVPTPLQGDTFWSMGDVNREGYIDDTDLNRISDKYDWVGPPGSIPEDINSDGKVDIYDQLTCIYNLGLKIWTHFSLGTVIQEETIVDMPPATISKLMYT